LIDPDVDLVGSSSRFATKSDLEGELLERYEAVVTVSAAQGVGIENLLAEIENMLARQMVDVDTTLPYSAGDLVSLWHKYGVIEGTEYDEKGMHVRGKLPTWLVSVFKEAQLDA